METFPNGPNSLESRKMTLDERADSPEKGEKLVSLRQRARAIEEKLASSLGTAPSEKRAWDATSQILEELIALANDARDFGVHYGGFHVGAAPLGLRKTEHPWQNPWVVMFDANVKPSVQYKKWCAELDLMSRASGASPNTDSGEKLYRILSFVIVANPRSDDVSKVQQITLTPCKLCRDDMVRRTQGEDAIISPETEVITAQAAEPRFRKYQKVKDLHAFHGEYVDLE